MHGKNSRNNGDYWDAEITAWILRQKENRDLIAFLARFVFQCATDFSDCQPDLHLSRSMFILPFYENMFT